MEAESIIFFVSLAWAALIILCAWLTAPSDVKRSDLMKGPAEWSLKESWASNLTAVGAILTAALNVKAIQATADNKAFMLSIFFVALTTTAPFLYNAAGTESRTRTVPGGGVKKEVEASLLIFLSASTMTLWGVSGQLLTLGWVVCRLLRKETFFLLFASFELLLGLSFLLILPYAYRSIRGIIEDNRVTPQVDNASQQEPAPPPRSWSIL